VSATSAPDRIDGTCRTATFEDTFATYDISSGAVADGLHEGERWFNGTEQCCLSTSNGWPAVNFPTPSNATKQPVNPYALMPEGGLRIRASQQDSEWFSGVMTSVDKNGEGFSQMYGYFEITAKLPPGTGTWPSFWMLSLPMGAAGGEIDVFEQYGCNPPLNPENERRFHFTIHDWTHNESSYEFLTPVLDDLTADYHRYGVLWREGYLALYFDGALLSSGPVPSVMKDRKYYLLVDMGIGSGWDTVQTPNPSDLQVKAVRAWSLP
jgi:beta-glucanase (GH16 family)